MQMAGKTLSTEPTIDPTASVRESKLGAYTEVGARTFLRCERRPDHLHYDRKVLFDRGDDADQPG
jgi:hypothetical protein